MSTPQSKTDSSPTTTPPSGESASSAQKKAAVIKQKEHARRMSTDRAYAENFIKNSMPKGRVFTVCFEVEDELETQKLFAAVQPTGPLVAGCRVKTIYSGDAISHLLTIQNYVKAL